MYSDSYWASYKIVSLGPTRSMETNSQKKAILPMKNNFGEFFLVLPSMADLGKHFIRLHKLLGSSLSKL